MELPKAWPSETDWTQCLRSHLASESFQNLAQFIAQERTEHEVYPAAAQTFRAFEVTPYARTRVVILGQDPYHGPGQAHGLAFSVPLGVKTPPSLRNILRELCNDLGIPNPKADCGDLTSWGEQGVLLLNTVLTVRRGTPGSHQKKGWEAFTDHVIESLNRHPHRLVFILWGKPASQKKSLIDSRHATIESSHPSPLSAYRGFLDSRPFSKTNNILQSHGTQPIDWESIYQEQNR